MRMVFIRTILSKKLYNKVYWRHYDITNLDYVDKDEILNLLDETCIIKEEKKKWIFYRYLEEQ